MRFTNFEGILGFSVPSIIWVGTGLIIIIIIIIILIIMFIYSASNLKVPAKAHYKSNKKYEKVIKNKNV